MIDKYAYIESEDLYEMAMEWLKNNKFDKAIDLLKKAIDLNPMFIGAYIDLSKIYAKKKDFHNAINTLKKASKFDPQFHKLNYYMAKYAFKIGDYPKSLKYINMAIDKSPEKLYIKSKIIIEFYIKKLKDEYTKNK